MTPHLYGIPNCDSVKKARAWLAEQQASCEFHDYKKEGVDPQTLQTWCDALGWDKLLNRQGTTWRKLDASTQQTLKDSTSAQRLMLAQPSLIKRPVVDWGGEPAHRFTVGFDAAVWRKRLG